MSNFETYDNPIADVQPLESFEGVYVGAVEEVCPVHAAEPERTEIRIVAGRGGSFVGSEIYINGESIPRLTAFSVSGDMDSCWETVIRQVVRDV